jgi:hypothetical protein
MTKAHLRLRSAFFFARQYHHHSVASCPRTSQSRRAVERCAILRGPPAALVITVSGTHHDRQVGKALLDLDEQLQPIHARHVDVGEDRDQGRLDLAGLPTRRSGRAGACSTLGKERRRVGGNSRRRSGLARPAPMKAPSPAQAYAQAVNEMSVAVEARRSPRPHHRYRLTPKSCPTRAGRLKAATSRAMPSTPEGRARAGVADGD